jgi:hypothetical protein
MPQGMKDRLDEPKYGFSADEWELPEEGDGIDCRWLDAFIAVRLQDVIARRFYGMPFPKLSVQDRTVIRGRTEFFIAQLAAVLEGEEE